MNDNDEKDARKEKLKSKRGIRALVIFVYAVAPGFAFFLVLTLLLHVPWWFILPAAFVGITIAAVGFTLGYKSHRMQR